MTQSMGVLSAAEETSCPMLQVRFGSVSAFLEFNALLLVCISIMCPLVINGDIMPTEKTKRPQKYLHSSIINTKS